MNILIYCTTSGDWRFHRYCFRLVEQLSCCNCYCYVDVNHNSTFELPSVATESKF